MRAFASVLRLGGRRARGSEAVRVRRRVLAGCAGSEGDFDDRAATVECPCHGSVFDVGRESRSMAPLRTRSIHQARLVDGWVELADQPVPQGGG